MMLIKPGWLLVSFITDFRFSTDSPPLYYLAVWQPLSPLHPWSPGCTPDPCPGGAKGRLWNFASNPPRTEETEAKPCLFWEDEATCQILGPLTFFRERKKPLWFEGPLAQCSQVYLHLKMFSGGTSALLYLLP